MDTPYQLLIVEDDADTGVMLREYFGLHGYRVRVATWGKEAIVQCRQAPPDLILLDIRLPDMDGYEVCSRLRQQPGTKHTPVIFLTERRSRDDRLTGLQLGAVDYMTKPFDTEELLLRVRNALRQASQEYLTNPVTDLTVEPAMKERLRSLVGQDERAVLYIRLQNLESWGQDYGFPACDEALRAVADLLDNVVAEWGGDKDFVGHLGEADFALVTSPARVKTLQEEIEARLPRTLRRPAAPRREDAEKGAPAMPSFSVAIGLLTGDDLASGDE